MCETSILKIFINPWDMFFSMDDLEDLSDREILGEICRMRNNCSLRLNKAYFTNVKYPIDYTDVEDFEF